jgi:hypothetical protein
MINVVSSSVETSGSAPAGALFIGGGPAVESSGNIQVISVSNTATPPPPAPTTAKPNP